MPNWCWNHVEIDNPKGGARAVAELLCPNGEFDFGSVVPMPEILRHTVSGSKSFNGEKLRSWFVENPDAEWKERRERPFNDSELAQLAKIGADNWYDWSIQHWGTKWNAGECDLTVTDNSIRIDFTTAWAPPSPVLQAIAERFECYVVNGWYEEGGAGGRDCFYADEEAA